MGEVIFRRKGYKNNYMTKGKSEETINDTIDTRMLKKKQSFTALRDSYVIFFYKRDKFRKGLPLYHVERYVEETDQPFED